MDTGATLCLRYYISEHYDIHYSSSRLGLEVEAVLYHNLHYCDIRCDSVISFLLEVCMMLMLMPVPVPSTNSRQLQLQLQLSPTNVLNALLIIVYN